MIIFSRVCCLVNALFYIVLVLLLLCHDDVMVLLLQALELRGVLDLLGVWHTVGSVDTLPPSREQLMATFNDQLTVT